MIRTALAPLVALLMLLAACSDPEKTARYLVDPPTAARELPNRLGAAELRDVSLPEYAAHDEIAWQTPDGAVRSNPRNIWADNPQRAFTLVLARSISELSGATVIAEPWPLMTTPDRKIDVRVERALAQANGTYRLAGSYYVSDETGAAGGNHARSFDIVVPLSGSGPGAVSLAQSAAITQLARQIATLGGPGSSFVTRRPAATDPFDLPPLL
ncbi:MAG: PqiC family protein [Paracoccus sp. (in: a-proteobacteria)]|uniref:PqiC family protein n=1 Tax=Paracoccus sp. TaxID=267 RepID=UPI0026E06189|nr:PqiC family protein [Paracoccus sp. (in: a-proteobacteria)]MDO5612602.1 PqiC family protein [Paracoccus sp. (in: a-proteobacteria)]